MYPAETSRLSGMTGRPQENIKSDRLWRTETDREHKYLLYLKIIKLKNRWCAIVLPKGQVAFCFSVSQRKAKK
jgi:hypothetical protein